MNSNDEKDGDSGSTAKTSFKYILERICGQTYPAKRQSQMILIHCNQFVYPHVHEREPTLKQKHVVHDIVDMTSYIELHQQQKSNPVCVHPHQVRHCQDVEF
ncbi:unnamed protein product [Sphagnum troendelagicum]|uniref:Uncharacterized protein n=1 Tax=Sphagnum troendelagicum TaxID=128251 RepID=A0ABP0UKP3_9BRYO